MRTVRLAKSEFDLVVYPLLAKQPGENIQDIRTTDRVLTKLEEASTSNGQEVPLFKLDDEDGAEFELEETEADLVVKRLKSGLQSLPVSISRMVPSILERLQGGD